MEIKWRYYVKEVRTKGTLFRKERSLIHMSTWIERSAIEELVRLENEHPENMDNYKIEKRLMTLH